MDKNTVPASASTIAAALASYAGVSSRRLDQMVARMFAKTDADMAFTAESIRDKAKRSFAPQEG